MTLNPRAWLRLGATTIHDIASIAFGGALTGCLVINLTTPVAAPAQYMAARQIFNAVAQYILVPTEAARQFGRHLVAAVLAAEQERGHANWRSS